MKIAKNQEKSKKQNKNANTSWYCKKKSKKSGNRVNIDWFSRSTSKHKFGREWVFSKYLEIKWVQNGCFETEVVVMSMM
jgi:hypothetical protein